MVTSEARASNAANPGNPMLAITTRPSARSQDGEWRPQPRSSVIRPVPAHVPDSAGPDRERAAGHDHEMIQALAGARRTRVKRSHGQHGHPGVAHDRVADDMLQVILDECRHCREQD